MFALVVKRRFVLTGCLMAVSTADCPPGRHTGLTNDPSALMQLPDKALEEKFSQAPAGSQQKQAATVRTRALTDQDGSASGREPAPVDAGLTPQAAAQTHLRPHKPSPSQAGCVKVSVRSKSWDMYQPAVDSCKADDCYDLKRYKPFLLQEAPVRDEKRSDWSLTSSDSDAGFPVSRPSYSARKVEPVRPFSVSAASAGDLGDFGGFTPDVSDVTVYNEIAKKTPHAQTASHAKMSSHREPTPGSEASGQLGVCSRPLFSELRQRQQDSGFDSPFSQQK